jgi:hypothetical protein
MSVDSPIGEMKKGILRRGALSRHWTALLSLDSLDLAASLRQVLADGQSTFSYGLGRIAQRGPAGAQYFLGDALASLRPGSDADSNAHAHTYTIPNPNADAGTRHIGDRRGCSRGA